MYVLQHITYLELHCLEMVCLKEVQKSVSRTSKNRRTPDRRQLKTLISTKVVPKSSETEFSIAICRPTGDKCQSKTLFLAFFDSRSSVVKIVFDCRLSDVSRCTEG